MTFQSELLLHKLRKAESYDGQLLFIDYDSHHITGLHEAAEPFKTVSFVERPEEIKSALEYLQDCHRLIIHPHSYVELLHTGSHIWQARLSWFANSILLPIFVSIATTLITLTISS